MTVLVLAAERDPTADRMLRELTRRSVPVLRCDTAWFPAGVSLDAQLQDGAWDGVLTVLGRRVALGDLRSVWYRSPSAFRFPDGLSGPERQWAAQEAKIGLGGVLGALPLRWVNHPARVADAEVKPVQLVVAARCGLIVPETLVTNVHCAVREFAARGRTVTKALAAAAIVESGRRHTVFTHLLDPPDLDDLRGLGVTTHQFQRWVDKAHEARVVVDEQVFAAGIHAGGPDTVVDWRNDYTALAYSRVDPPAGVVDGVRRYCAEFGLVYGAFDFVVRPDGGWVFLECNAGGQYGWIEDAVSAPITATLADVLARGAA
jgi:ATP-grasp ribosomal peptide maturase